MSSSIALGTSVSFATAYAITMDVYVILKCKAGYVHCYRNERRDFNYRAYFNVKQLGEIDKQMEIGEFLPRFLILKFLHILLDFFWLRRGRSNKQTNKVELIQCLRLHIMLCLQIDRLCFQLGNQHAS